MSLYNQLFGENENATALLGMIEITRNDFQRYRDVWLNKDATIITVLTRIGGGNRKEYKKVYENIRQNKFYVKDFDDNFDETYAYIKFRVPEKYKYTCEKIAPKEEHLSIKEMFDKEIAESKNPNSPAFKRMEEIAQKIIDQIDKGNNIINL